ncbi:TRAP transporter substrate-binding protein [Pseudomonas sp. MAP12]|uniref:TRAP transporter substrate-binding protein n=2 Tax=Geopseudomonas aromaticivorans TaxID=2849492 RepID=A0ABS6N0Z6_9GAMM|nr:TRAP transporter substrate-binding protein [Pseudomonas aromaticivorans]
MSASLAATAAPQSTVTLKVHHFMPNDSLTQRELIQPWAEKITRESAGRIRFHFFPEMQLGGTPAQLVDQVRDGTADIVWALPGYSSGRFPLTGAFELPFMNRSAEASSQALWDFLQANGQREYQGIHLLATHLTDSVLLHTRKQPILSMADFAGLKLRTANPVQSRLIELFGGLPQAMPINPVPAALARGLLDGAAVPWDVATAVKLQKRVKHHTEMAEGMPKLMHAALVLAMNQARYDSLPADLRQIIDANSGRALSAQAGRLWDTRVEENGRQLARAQDNQIHTLAPEEQQRWMEAARSLDGEWVTAVEGQGYANGAGLLKTARQLVAKYNGQAAR